MTPPENSERRLRTRTRGAESSLGGDNSMLLVPTHARVELEAVRCAWAAH